MAEFSFYIPATKWPWMVLAFALAYASYTDQPLPVVAGIWLAWFAWTQYRGRVLDYRVAHARRVALEDWDDD